MDNIENKLRDASELRKTKQYGAAVDGYEKIFSIASSAFKQWDAWNYIYSLQQIKNYEKALELCRHFYPKYKDFEPLREAYAWCIYYTIFSKNAPYTPSDEADKALEQFGNFTQQIKSLTLFSDLVLPESNKLKKAYSPIGKRFGRYLHS